MESSRPPISPILYALMLGMALFTGLCGGLYILLSQIPTVDAVGTYMTIIGVLGLALAVAHIWLLRWAHPTGRLRVIASQVIGGMLNGVMMGWLVTVLRPQLVERGVLDPLKVSLLFGLSGILLGGPVGWIAWKRPYRTLALATLLGWGLGTAACGWLMALFNTLIYASGF